MNIEFTTEQIMLRKQIRKFVEAEIEPIAAEIDKEHRYPTETIAKLFKYGYVAVGFPEEYGGTGFDRVSQVIVTEEIARKCAATAAIYSIHQGSVWPLQLFGNKDQKDQYMNKIMHEGMIIGFALTEPNAGSDASNSQTVAVEDGDSYIINGTKCFITGAGICGVYMILAMTEPNKKTRGMTAFLVDANTPGVSIGKIEDKMGIRGSQTGEVILRDVKVPKSSIIGEYNKGFKIALTCIDGSRICIAAAQALGMAEEAFELAVKYSKERKQFGAAISDNQGIQWYLAEMKSKLEAARLITYHAAKVSQVKKRYSEEASISKLVASENARFIIERALQIHGGYGYMREYSLERMYRDQKITEIYEGTNEICKMVIARSVLS